MPPMPWPLPSAMPTLSACASASAAERAALPYNGGAMIEYLKGRISASGENAVVIEVGGMAVRSLCSLSTISQLHGHSGEATLYTRLLLRENNPPELFGFAGEDERSVFDQLCEVKGVSGRIALNILSALSPVDAVMAIQQQDGARLQQANGVGRRLAERIVVELRERLAKIDISDGGGAPVVVGSVAADAIAGLVALGYKSGEARAAVTDYLRKSPGDSKPATIIQNVLKRR